MDGARSAELATGTMERALARWVRTRRETINVLTRAIALPCTTLRPQCVPERSATALRNCCVLFAYCAVCAHTPNREMLLSRAPQPDLFVEIVVVVALEGDVVVVVGSLSTGFKWTGLIGWATR